MAVVAADVDMNSHHKKDHHYYFEERITMLTFAPALGCDLINQNVRFVKLMCRQPHGHPVYVVVELCYCCAFISFTRGHKQTEK